MSRYHLLAAEIYGYSFANYQDHLGIGNIRYEKLMPDDARKLERADRESWTLERIARELDTDTDEAAARLEGYRRARAVVDAENPAESFRTAVRQAIEHAAAEGLGDAASIEELVKQICYRASDLSVLLEREGQKLSRYSRHLRRESDVDYHEGYFDEEG
jgi:hypothetical protein